MTVVIDVGAARYGGDYSMERLIEQFEPTHLYAIDPNQNLSLPTQRCPEHNMPDCSPLLNGCSWRPTEIHLVHAAAWIETDMVGYQDDGLNSWLTNNPSAPLVASINLASFVKTLATRHDDRLVLKLDCEGSEYELLDHLILNNADELLDLCIVEWHPKSEPAHEALSQDIKKRIRCELREWPY